MVCPCALGGSDPMVGGGANQGGYRATPLGGYRATRRNRAMLRAYKRGKSIGFTGVASLKAKGLLPRTSGKYRGKYVLGPKYSGTRKNKILNKRTTRRSRYSK